MLPFCSCGEPKCSGPGVDCTKATCFDSKGKQMKVE